MSNIYHRSVSMFVVVVAVVLLAYYSTRAVGTFRRHDGASARAERRL